VAATRETREQKAVRFIATERVRVQAFGAGYVVARVAGDTDDYCVTWAGKSWQCECEANRDYGKTCSHIIAVRMIWRAIQAALTEGGRDGGSRA
jgi:hypothetical protein